MARAAAVRTQIQADRSSVSWSVPGNLPPGAEYHLIYEDPKTHGITALVRLPAGYALAPHFHSSDETIVIVSGKLEVTSQGKTATLKPGAYAVFPAGASHAFKAVGWWDCEMVMITSGPYDVHPAESARTR